MGVHLQFLFGELDTESRQDLSLQFGTSCKLDTTVVVRDLSIVHTVVDEWLGENVKADLFYHLYPQSVILCMRVLRRIGELVTAPVITANEDT